MALGSIGTPSATSAPSARVTAGLILFLPRNSFAHFCSALLHSASLARNVSRHRDLLLGRRHRAVVVDPGELEGAALLDLGGKLHVRVGGPPRLHLGTENPLAGELRAATARD